MKEELESHQEKGEEGLDWVKPDVTPSPAVSDRFYTPLDKSSIKSISD